MRTISVRRISDFRKLAAVGAFGALAAAVPALAQQPANQPSPAPPASSSLGSAPQAAHGKVFDTPQQAANALIDAAAKFDETALVEIFGPDGQDVVFTGELPQDRQRASDFAAEAHEKTSVSVESKSGNRAFILVGNEQWPFPVPIVKSGDRWYFDSKAGRQELLYRRIGANELSAIDICKGFVEAQDDFAFRKRKEYDVNQYAQNIIAPSGTKDGLAWQESDGSWSGPIGEKIAARHPTGIQHERGTVSRLLLQSLEGPRSGSTNGRNELRRQRDHDWRLRFGGCSSGVPSDRREDFHCQQRRCRIREGFRTCNSRRIQEDGALQSR